jgi:hypothetical protein
VVGFRGWEGFKGSLAGEREKKVFFTKLLRQIRCPFVTRIILRNRVKSWRRGKNMTTYLLNTMRNNL